MDSSFVEEFQSACKVAKHKGPVKTIGVFCWSDFGGGAERATYLWAHKLVAAMDVRIVWMHVSPLMRQPDSSLPIVFRQISGYPDKRLESVKKVLIEENVDTCLVVAIDSEITYTDILAARQCGCRQIVVDHSSFFYPLDAFVRAFDIFGLRAKILQEAELVVALSPQNVTCWRAAGLNNVTWIPNFLTFEPKEVSAVDPWLRLTNREFVMCGRISPIKGQDLVLRAFAKFIERYDEGHRYRMTFLGRFDNADYEAYIRGIVSECHLEKYVEFKGEVKDVATYYRRATLLLMGSKTEGAPMVLTEAKAYGLPALVFDLPLVAGIGDRYGVLSVLYGDLDAYAESLHRVVTDKEYYLALAQASRAALVGYGSEELLARWCEYLKRIGEGGRIVEEGGEKPPELVGEMIRSLIRLVPSLETVKDELSKAHRKIGDLQWELSYVNNKWKELTKDNRACHMVWVPYKNKFIELSLLGCWWVVAIVISVLQMLYRLFVYPLPFGIYYGYLRLFKKKYRWTHACFPCMNVFLKLLLPNFIIRLEMMRWRKRYWVKKNDRKKV